MTKVILYMKAYYGMIICSIALLFFQAMTDLALPDLMSDIINTGVIRGNLPFIWTTGGKMLIYTFAGAAASVAVGYLAALIAAGVATRMRTDVFKKVTSFGGEEFDKFSTASLITRTTNDITQVQTLLVMVIRLIFYAPILGVGGIIKAVANSATMSWVIGVAVITLLSVIAVLFSIALPKFKLVQDLIDRLNLVVRENLDGILVVRAFNTQKFELNRFDKANSDLTAVNLFVNRAMSLMMPVMMLVMNVTTVVIVWVGAKQVTSFKMDIGSMIAYMQYGMQIIFAFLMLAVMFILIPRAAVSAQRIAQVIDTEVSIKDTENPESFDDDFAPEVAFDNVSFLYPGSDGYVLKDISFTAKPGKTTAFIGSTGSGKSTVVSLLMRFYDVSSGSIRVGGKDIRDITRKQLREKIGYVPQKSVLFSGTVMSNLKYADENSSPENIENASKIAQAFEFINSKPDKYETVIAQGGTNVSGGQKQRLSIARALVKNAPIYIFDDSFSALDLKTDSRLRAALKKQTGKSTILLVAQRVSTIMNADQIIVLENGRVAGIGTHKQLLETCEVYSEIAHSQLGGEELAK